MAPWSEDSITEVLTYFGRWLCCHLWISELGNTVKDNIKFEQPILNCSLLFLGADFPGTSMESNYWVFTTYCVLGKSSTYIFPFDPHKSLLREVWLSPLQKWRLRWSDLPKVTGQGSGWERFRPWGYDCRVQGVHLCSDVPYCLHVINVCEGRISFPWPEKALRSGIVVKEPVTHKCQ